MFFERWRLNLSRLMGGGGGTAKIDHRSDERSQCLITSEFSYCGSVDCALIRNLNRSGAFVETHHRFCVGEEVRLKFPLHYLDPPIEVAGVIAWTDINGVGVKFKPAAKQ